MNHALTWSTDESGRTNAFLQDENGIAYHTFELSRDARHRIFTRNGVTFVEPFVQAPKDADLIWTVQTVAGQVLETIDHRIGIEGRRALKVANNTIARFTAEEGEMSGPMSRLVVILADEMFKELGAKP